MLTTAAVKTVIKRAQVNGRTVKWKQTLCSILYQKKKRCNCECNSLFFVGARVFCARRRSMSFWVRAPLLLPQACACECDCAVWELKPVLLGSSPPALGSVCVYSQSSGTDRDCHHLRLSWELLQNERWEKKKKGEVVLEKSWEEGGERGGRNYRAEKKLISAYAESPLPLFTAHTHTHAQASPIAFSSPFMSSFGRKQSIRQRSEYPHFHCTVYVEGGAEENVATQ